MAPPVPKASRQDLPLPGMGCDRNADRLDDHWPYHAQWRAEKTEEAYAEWIETWADWEVFATLTYDPKRHPWCPSDAEVSRHFKAWVGGIVGLAPVQVRGIGAIELHASGWPHIHALLGWPKRAPATADLRKWRHALYSPWYHAHGYADVRPVDRPDAGARYVSKYLSKTLRDNLAPGLLLAPDPLTSSWRSA